MIIMKITAGTIPRDSGISGFLSCSTGLFKSFPNILAFKVYDFNIGMAEFERKKPNTEIASVSPAIFQRARSGGSLKRAKIIGMKSEIPISLILSMLKGKPR